MRPLNIFVAALAACALSAAAHSAAPSPAALQALAGATPQAEVCAADDYAAPGVPGVNEAPAPRVDAALRAACRLSLRQMLAARNGTPQVIDVRLRDAYAESHVDGALNLAPAEIKTKHYLANRPVLLIGDGKDDELLLETCAALRQHGFAQARVLLGGMVAWAAAAQPVLGRAADAYERAQLTPAELQRLGADPANLAVDALNSEAQMRRDRRAWRRSVVDQARGLWRSALRSHPPERLVVAAGAGADRLLYADLQAVAGDKPVLIYTDSVAAYRRQLSVQTALLKRPQPRRPGCRAM